MRRQSLKSFIAKHLRTFCLLLKQNFKQILLLIKAELFLEDTGIALGSI